MKRSIRGRGYLKIGTFFLTLTLLVLPAFPNHAAAAKVSLSCSSATNLSQNPIGMSSSTTDESGDPIVSGNNVYIIWATMNVSSGKNQVLLAVSVDAGETFGSPVPMSDPSINARSAKLAAGGSSVYAAWVGGKSIYLRTSHDKGGSFGPPVVLSGTTSSLGVTISASNAGEVFVAWLGDLAGVKSVFVRASHDFGDSFSPAQVLSPPGEDSKEISIGMSGQNSYVTWIDFALSPQAVLFRASHDSGTSFGPAINLSIGSARSIEPIVSATEGNSFVYVVWRDQITPGDSEIFFARSTDAGDTFGGAANLSDNTALTREVSIASSNTNVYVVYRNPESGTFRVYFKASHDGGLTFTPAKDLSGRTGIKNITHQYIPSMTVVPGASATSDKVFVAWSTKVSSAQDVLLRRSVNSGQTFSSPSNLSNNTADSWNQLVAARGNSAFVIWLDGSTQTRFDVLVGKCS